MHEQAKIYRKIYIRSDIMSKQVLGLKVDNVPREHTGFNEMLPIHSSSRPERDAGPSLARIKPNSTTTHVSNTTMVQMLNRLAKQSSNQVFEKPQPATNLDDDEMSEAKSVVVQVSQASFDSMRSQDASLGDLDNLIKNEPDDLATAANYDSKKYMLVKKKPKHKKIKMEVYEPEMKYKKIKMKIPVKKMKKKKVKGYLVKKEKYYHH